MDIEYYRGNNNLVVWFEPSELSFAVDTLRKSLDEAKEKRMHIPVYTEDFFENLSTAKTKKGIVFNFAYLEIGMQFVKRVSVLMESDDVGASSVEETLNELWGDVSPYCVMDSTLH